MSWGNRVITNLTEFTVPEKILLAAEQLEKQGQSPFSAEALIVAAWTQFPRTFGLKGFADQYPDSNKVLSSIMGVKGLARRGWLVKMGQKLYSLSREGRSIVRKVLQQDDEPAPASSTIHLSRDHESSCCRSGHTSRCRSLRRTAGGLTFADACRFWGITENMKGDQLDAKLHQFEQMLKDLDRTLSDGDAEVTGGRVISAGDLRVVSNIHHHMEEKFGRHINLLRSRSGRK
jgi:hypothetical protein